MDDVMSDIFMSCEEKKNQGKRKRNNSKRGSDFSRAMTVRNTDSHVTFLGRRFKAHEWEMQTLSWYFPGGQVLPMQGCRFHPGWGTKIPLTAESGQEIKKKSRAGWAWIP